MLRLTRIEEGACYVTETTNLYVAWSMLLNSSKLFWGCEIIKDLGKVKSLSDQAFGDKPEVFSEFIELLQNAESPTLDAVRISRSRNSLNEPENRVRAYAPHPVFGDLLGIGPTFVKY